MLWLCVYEKLFLKYCTMFLSVWVSLSIGAGLLVENSYLTVADACWLVIAWNILRNVRLSVSYVLVQFFHVESRSRRNTHQLPLDEVLRDAGRAERAGHLHHSSSSSQTDCHRQLYFLSFVLRLTENLSTLLSTTKCLCFSRGCREYLHFTFVFCCF